MVDPADVRANARRRLSLSRELQQERETMPHPRIGGSRGYPVYFREAELERHANGEPTSVSAASISRWKQRIEPYRRTGNRDKEDLVGPDLVLLAIVVTVYPNATLDEMAMFIAAEGGGVYHNDLISKRLAGLYITKKRSSVEAYKAFTPANLRREYLFWNRPLPLGVMGIPRRKFIDVDEFAMEHRRANRNRGWGVSFRRVRTVGNYVKGEKLTVMIAIEPGDPNLPPDSSGSIANPRRWCRIRRVAGTSADDFANFMNYVCTDIEETNHIEGGTDAHRVFLWDNLSAHGSPIVYQTVEARHGPTRFNILPRPAYQPKYGPIEYKICDLINYMKLNTQREMDLAQMEQKIQEAVGAIGPFDSTFAHCGYSIDGLY